MSFKNFTNFFVGEQKLSIGNVGNYISCKNVPSLFVHRNDSARRGVEDLSNFLYHVINYAVCNGFKI